MRRWKKHRGKALFVLVADRLAIHCLAAGAMLLLQVYEHLIHYKRKKKKRAILTSSESLAPESRSVF